LQAISIELRVQADHDPFPFGGEPLISDPSPPPINFPPSVRINAQRELPLLLPLHEVLMFGRHLFLFTFFLPLSHWDVLVDRSAECFEKAGACFYGLCRYGQMANGVLNITSIPHHSVPALVSTQGSYYVSFSDIFEWSPFFLIRTPRDHRPAPPFSATEPSVFSALCSLPFPPL